MSLSIGPVNRALLALALGSFGLATGEFVTLGLLPNMADSLHVSIPRAGYLISAYALGVVVGAPLLTIAAIRLPRKGLIITLTLALATGNFLSAIVPNFEWLLVVRFLAALPHGAYFGVASVAAGSLVERHKRSSAMGMVFAGLTVANIVGVPLTTLIGQQTGWRFVFVLVGLIEVLAAVGILALVPVQRDEPGTPKPQLRDELHAFRSRPIWLALAICTIGGGAMFATFSYIAPMMTHLAGYSESSITPLLVLFGIGMTGGNLVGARLADRNLMGTVYAAMAAEIVIALLFVLTAHNKITAAITIVLFPFAAMAMLPALQSHLIHLAGGAPNLAAASMHSAFNIANSIGAWLGGLTIAAGYGYGSPNVVAAGLATLGLGLALIAGRNERNNRARPVPAEAEATPAAVTVE